VILLHSSDLDSRLALRRPQRARRRRTLAFPCSGLAAIVGLCTLFGCRADVVEEKPSHTVEIGPIERIVIATGTIEPATEVEIRPRIPGIIEQIHVEEGDVVEVGQALIEIERELLASQVREAEAHQDSAGVEFRFAKIALDRMQELHLTGASSDQAHDDASARYERARADRARAKAAVDTLRTQLGYATVKSSMLGRVLAVHVEEGNAVSPVTSVTGGTLLLSIAGDKTLHLEGLVDENEIARVALDQRARIRTEAFGDRIFEGRVREIAPMGQRVQNVTYFEVKVEIIDAEAQLLRPRMSGDAEIITEIVKDAVIVPETALRYRGDDILVDLANAEGDEEDDAGEQAESGRVVEIGVMDGDRVQILNGLEAGDRVLLQ
jgi:HlyD family secretion protein